VSAVTPALPRVRARVLSPRVAVGAVVVAGTVIQALLARLVVMPSVFPDEYLYSQLGRSLAKTGHLTIRGVNPHFLPVLEPILTAPVWLAHDVGTSFRLLQLENAFVMSLAAIPAYLIARRLGAGTWLGVGAAAFSISGPPAIFTAMALSEPFAYPLALGVVAAALALFERPSLRAQLVLLVLVGLACFDRLQLAALPLSIAVAVVFVGLREHRLVRALREQWLLVGITIVGALGGLTITLVHGLGYYKLHPHTRSGLDALRFSGVSLYVIVLATGVAVVPSAVVGLALALAKPRTRAEAAFGAVTTSFLVATIVQCVVWGDVQRVQERYLGYLLPLIGLAFVARFTRRERSLVPEIGVAAGIAAVAALVPLNGYAIDADHYMAPTFYAFARAQEIFHVASTAMVFAAAATLLAIIGALNRRAALVMSIAASLTLLVAASAWSGRLTHALRSSYLPSDKQWIDHADGGSATMLVVGKSTDQKNYSGQALETLIWNPSMASVVRLDGARNVDWLNDPVAHVAADGTIDVGGHPLRGAVVVAASQQTSVALRSARLVRSFSAMTLWRARGNAKLWAIVDNRLGDGRVVGPGPVHVWSGTPRLAGWIVMRAYAPPVLGEASIRLGSAKVAVPSGTIRTVRVRACGKGPWTGTLAAKPDQVIRGVWTSPLVSVPRYVADPAACT
jgi:hypothetical protein